MAQEDYRKALRLGQKEFRSSVLKGTYPYLQALDEILEHTAVEYTEPLGVVNIPLASIVGTKATEQAQNWHPLCDAHLSVGIRDPIKAYEYMNKFYVEEGNKRVSVMKYYEAMSIPGSVTRIVPRRSEDKENKIYYEFLDFYDLTGVNYLWFSQLGRFRASRPPHPPRHTSSRTTSPPRTLRPGSRLSGFPSWDASGQWTRRSTAARGSRGAKKTGGTSRRHITISRMRSTAAAARGCLLPWGTRF